MKSKIIIAGADGYIGQRLQKSIPDQNQLVLLSPVQQDLYIPFDLLQISNFNFDLINKSDTLIFLAGISSPDICSRQYQLAFKVNVTGTIEFISKCLLKGTRVLFFSSDTIYGNSNDNNDEVVVPVYPVGEYGNMKLLVEKYFTGEANFKSFRLSYVFSWNDKFTKYLRDCLEQNNTAEIYDPFIRRCVYIEDVIECIINITNTWDQFNNQFFNLCGPDYLSRVEIANYFIRQIGLLNLKIIRPDEEFFKARPERINISSKYSTHLLGKNFTPIYEALENEKILHNKYQNQ